MVNCMSEQYNIDSDRVHVTGMSLGGILHRHAHRDAQRRDCVCSTVFWWALREGGGLIPLILTLVSWGGEDDTYYGQDFHNLAALMTERLGWQRPLRDQLQSRLGSLARCGGLGLMPSASPWIIPAV